MSFFVLLHFFDIVITRVSKKSVIPVFAEGKACPCECRDTGIYIELVEIPALLAEFTPADAGARKPE